MRRFASTSPAVARETWVTIVFVVTALLLGGQSVFPTFLDAAVQVLAVLGIATIVAFPRDDAPGLSGLAIAVLIAIIAVPFAQLTPLPPLLWAVLPGHALAADALTHAGLAHRWRPISLDPAGTRLALQQMLPGLAAFILTARLDGDRRRRVVIAIVAVGGFSLALGALQAAAGLGSPLYPYPTDHEGLSVGIFSNRNHQADLGIVTILLAAALVSAQPQARASILAVCGIGLAAAFFAFSIVATESRTGSLLFCLTVPVAIYLVRQSLPKRSIKWLALAMIALVAIAVLFFGERSNELMGRFLAKSDLREVFWPDVIYLAQQYFPFGSGLGSFDASYRTIESLSGVNDHYVNAAHNDYLQIFAETGILALPALILFFIWLVRSGLRRSTQSGFAIRVAAFAGIGVLITHSVVDYPLRTITLSTVFGVLCAFLVPAGEPRARRSAGRDRPVPL